MEFRILNRPLDPSKSGTSQLHTLLHQQASRAWVQNKVDESKHEIHSQVGAITAGTASVVNLTAGEQTK